MHQTSCFTILPCLDPCCLIQISRHICTNSPILRCPDFRVCNPDFSIFDFLLTRFCCPTKGYMILISFFEIHRCLILISGYILFTNPPSYLYNLALISGCLILISGFILCTNPPSLLYYLALISGCPILI